MVALVERQDFQQENMEQWITFKLVPAYFAQTREEATQKKVFLFKAANETCSNKFSQWLVTKKPQKTK